MCMEKHGFYQEEDGVVDDKEVYRSAYVCCDWYFTKSSEVRFRDDRRHNSTDGESESEDYCVLERYVLGCVTDLEKGLAYHNNFLLCGCQVFHILFWTFKQYSLAFQYYKPLVQIDGTFMYGRYIHWFLLIVAQDDNRKIFLIVLVITSEESIDNWDLFLFGLRRHVCPNLIYASSRIRELKYYPQLNNRETFGIGYTINIV
ncbi:hypothetical protein PVK06_008284 [Gossypium arboreum]|uniref:Uncharacterized protein n=1 Tax=Gossypium arboreum TaxID=29729 RepID=A0ABR0QJQ7_GOSAR|nr:hypothetical protein PVK06_008284 [Gossypium arboreum]